jgi:hypothetical protein
MQYKVVVGTNTDDLAKKVNGNIQLGWQPQGGVLINGMMYAQAMVKE